MILRLLAATLALALVAAPLPAAASEPIVRLLDAGKGKKAPLRLAPEVGATDAFVMVVDVAMSMSMGDQAMPAQAMPTMTVRADATVDSVSPDGDIGASFVYTGVDVADAAGLPPELVGSLRSTLGGLVGTKGTGVVTPRGIAKGGQLTLSEGTAPELADVLRTMEQTLSQVMAPLPEEPVGVGARWEVALTIVSGGMTIDNTTVYTLASRKGDVVVIDAEVQQSAQPQTIRTQGIEAQLRALTGGGKGTTTLDLSRVVPTRADIAVELRISMGVDADGTPMVLEMSTSTRSVLTATATR